MTNKLTTTPPIWLKSLGCYGNPEDHSPRTNRNAESRTVGIQTEYIEKISENSQTDDGFYVVEHFKTEEDIHHYLYWKNQHDRLCK